MNYSPYIPSEASGWITPVLINREPLLERIHEAIVDRSRQTWVFFIAGPGGIGKTRLIQEVLQRCRKDATGKTGSWYLPEVFAAREPVDLYHAYLHSEEGLARAIRAVIDPGPGYFEEYQIERDRLQRDKQDMSLLTRELYRRRRELVRIFLDDYDTAAREFRLVLALDTAEVIVDEPDPLQQTMVPTQTWVGVQHWLVEQFAPRIDNTVLLVAGRPEAVRLGDELSRVPNIRFEWVELEPFREEDTLTYFEAIIEAAREADEAEVAARIEAVPEETRQVIHHYTGGRPILLALMIDYLAVADQLLPTVQVTLAEARRKTADKESLQRVREELEADLVRVFHETGRDTDETLRLLAWSPKGMDAELLASVSAMGEPVTQADTDRAEKALERVRWPLSFVKIRPVDRRAFLHDEMYELLNRHVLSRATEERRAKIGQAILAYYRQRVAKLRRKIEQTDLSGEDLTDAYVDLYSAQVEEVYYHLRADPVTGFQTYYRYAEEAFWSDTPELDQELHTELRRYLRQAGADSPITRPAEQDLAIRLVKWEFQEGQWDKVIRLAGQLRKRQPDLFAEPLPAAELNLFEGWALVHKGVNLARAEERLQQAISSLQAFKPIGEFDNWRVTIALGSTHNILGYLYRSAGRLREATDEYKKAIPYWRQLPAFQTEHSNTLNNLGWASAQTGDFTAAILYARDALKMRQQLGSRYLMALSYNTLGLIEIEDNTPMQAVIHCKRAWEIFREEERYRGIGLATIGLAKALRRQAAMPDLHEPLEMVELLKEAEQHAREAVRVFSTEHKEAIRLVEALIELGCVYRDWANISVSYDHPRAGYASSQQLALQSERTLRRAAQAASNEITHLQVEALVNLAWLHYYRNDVDGARRVIETEVLPLIPDYLITEQGLSTLENPITFLWTQLGKAHNLLALLTFGAYHVANERYRNTRALADQELAYSHLSQATGEWTLALAYDRLFASDSGYARRRDLDWIHDCISKLNAEEINIVRSAAEETADQYALDKPTELQKYLQTMFGESTVRGETV